MARRSRMALVMLVAGFAGTALAGERGTAAEAKALLEKVVAGLKADKGSTLAAINKGGFNDRDLYPFCSGADGLVVAHGTDPKRIGMNQSKLKDAKGKAYGAEFRKVAKPGSISEVTYVYPRPGKTDPEPKVALVTRVGDLVCGVGYYK